MITRIIDSVELKRVGEQRELKRITERVEMIKSAPVIMQSGADMFKSTYDSNYDGRVDTCDYIDGGTF